LFPTEAIIIAAPKKGDEKITKPEGVREGEMTTKKGE
jgi:hypothetical protein